MKEYTLQELAKLTNSTLVGDPQHIIRNVADLESATEEDVSFLANPRYEKMMHTSRAGAIFIAPSSSLPPERNFLITSQPSEAFQAVLKIFHSEKQKISSYQGIHPTAIIHPSAILGNNVSIGPLVVIDNDVSIGDNTIISTGCYIGPHSKIGTDSLIHPRVTIREHCILGNRVIIQSGAVIGSCGFGYTQDKQGQHTKLEQLGSVEIGDDVEIGANTTIDRARFKKTVVGSGTKIDNLVQIAHGVQIGEHCLVIAQTGIAGSTTLGKHVILAGHVAVAGHLEIADGAMIAGFSGITKSIQKAGKYGGIPAQPLNDYNRNAVLLRNIDKFIEKIEALEEELSRLHSEKK